MKILKKPEASGNYQKKPAINWMVAGILLLASCTPCLASTITLQWNPVVVANLAGYKVYYKADSSVAPLNGTGAAQGAAPVDTAGQTSATITGLDPAHAYYFAVTAYNSAGVESPYSNFVSIPELVPPTASITFPSNNATASGTVSVTASASDNVGVTYVEFYVNGVLQATDTASPYLLSWNTSSLSPGAYTLQAKAYDAAGNVGLSSGISVTVMKDTTAPTVAMTAPVNGATISGTVALTASASDNVGVSKVEFYQNGTLLFAGNVLPYSYNWNTASVADGSYTITAKAYDAAGNIAQSANVAVTVKNSATDTAAPVVSLTSPSAGSTVTGTVSVSASASDNVGVTRVEFYANGVLQSTDTTSPYSFSWNSTAVANGSYLLSCKAYDAAGNVGSSANVTVAVNNGVSQSSPTYTIWPGSKVPALVDGGPDSSVELGVKFKSDASGSITGIRFYKASTNTGTHTGTLWSLSGTKLASATFVNETASGWQQVNFSTPVAITANTVYVASYHVNSGHYSDDQGFFSTGVDSAPLHALADGVSGYNSVYAYGSTSVFPNQGYKSTNYWVDVAFTSASPTLSSIAVSPGNKTISSGSGVQFTAIATYSDSSTKDVTGSAIWSSSSSATATISSGGFATGVNAGSSTISALLSGITGSATLTVPVPPAVSISAPVAGSTVGGMVPVSANATSSVGISKVDFYLNNALLTTVSAAPYSFNWNTPALANGTYTISAKAYDVVGDVGQAANVAVTVFNDSVAPSVSIAAPVAGSTVGGTAMVSANATDDVGVTKVEFYLNNILQSTASAAPFTFSWNTLAATNGAYTLSAKAYDAAGNVGQAGNVSVTVFNDTVAPSVSIASPAVSSTVGGTVSVTANASDNVGVTKVEFYLNGTLQATLTSAPYSFNWNTLAATNGAYTLSAKAYDAAGNVGQAGNVSVTVFNDTVAPSVSIASPAASSTVGGTVSVTANASDNVGVTKVEFYLNGTLQTTLTSAPYSFNWNTLAATNGAYTLSAKAYDAAGNVGQAGNVSVTVFNDTTAPVVSIASPVNNGTAGGTVSVSANASDNVGITKVEFYLNGALQATLTSAPYQFSWNTLAIANGPYIISAKGYDAAGNIGQSASITVTVFNDTVAPTMSAFTMPVSATTLTVPVTSLAATDNVGVTGYLITESSTAPAANATGWSSTAPVSFTFADFGSRTAYAWAKDAAGNVSASRSDAVTVTRPDTTAPVITVINPLAGEKVSTRETIKASATDNIAVTKMMLYVDNVLKATDTDGSISWTWNTTSYSRGAHVIKVIAYDAANNMSSSSITVSK
jgi:hypothetical protein